MEVIEVFKYKCPQTSDTQYGIKFTITMHELIEGSILNRQEHLAKKIGMEILTKLEEYNGKD